MSGEEIVESEDILYRFLEIVIGRGSGIAFVPEHQSAHSAGSRVGKQIDIDLIAL